MSNPTNQLSLQAHRWERIWILAKIEFKLRYYENKLGLLWALIKPISQIVMYYTVFQILLNQRIPNYAIYLWSGLFIWQFFVETTSGMIQILQTKKYLYTYTNMNKLEIYAAYMISSSIGIAINFSIFLISVIISGTLPTLHYLLFLPIFVNLLVLCLGINLILSNLFLLFKDITQVWGVVVSFGFFLSPILYRGELFEEKLPLLNYANPVSGIINNARSILLYAEFPDWQLFFFDFAYAFLILLVGLILLERIGPRAPELL